MFFKGMRVTTTQSGIDRNESIMMGMLGTIVCFKDFVNPYESRFPAIGVLFDDEICGHNISGLIESFNGWYCYSHSIKPLNGEFEKYIVKLNEGLI